MRICANPHCGEPIEGIQCQGRERPLPASALMRAKNDTVEDVTVRARRAQEYREHLERLQDARIMAMMPLERKNKK